MDNKEFIQEIISRLNEKFNGEIETIYHEKDDANGFILHQIIMKSKGSNIAPTINIDNMIKAKLSVDDAVDTCYLLYSKNKIDAFDTEWFLDFDGCIKQNLRARLYNKETKAEVFRDAKQYGLDNLIIIPYVKVRINDFEGSVKITEQHLDIWGKSADEVIEIALSNSAKFANLITISKMLADRAGVPIDSLGDLIMNDPLKIINTSENDGQYGAISAVTMQSQLNEMFPDGYYLIPASIHECIVFDANIADEVDDLDEMIQEINEQELSPNEVLGNNFYKMGGAN